MPKKLGQTLKRLIPTFILGTLAYLAGGTDVFDQRIHKVASKAFTDFGSQMLPFAVNLLVALVLLNLAYVFYHPIKDGAEHAFVRGHASERAKLFGIKALALMYWLIAALISLTIVFPDVLSKLLLGASLFGAAVTLALQGAANDFICGVLLQFTPKFKIDDQVIIGGLSLSSTDVTGKVTDINYLATTIATESGVINVPNRELWSRAVKVVDPNWKAPEETSVEPTLTPTSV